MTLKAKTFWILFVLFLVLDQVTKLWVWSTLAEGPRGDVITLIPGLLDIVHAQNPGAAFSMFRTFEYRTALFLGFTVVALWVVWDQIRRLPAGDGWTAAALGLIASGAVGNAIDRIHKGTVTDFIRVYVDAAGPREWLVARFGTNEWPSFNVADSALLVGVVIFFLTGLRKEPETAAAGAGDPKAATGE